MSRVVLIEAQPRRVDTGAVETVRLAGCGTRPYDQLGRLDWRAGVIDVPRFSTEIGFDQGGWNGGAMPVTGGVTFAPTRPELLAGVAALYWIDAPFALRLDDDETTAPSYPIALAGTVTAAQVAQGKLALTLSDLSRRLTVSVLTGRFAGTGGLEGDASAATRIKRLSWGPVWNVEGRLLIAAHNIHEFGDPRVGLSAFADVRDGGRSAKAIGVVGWQGSAGATLAALIASDPVDGGCTVAPSIACVKWWTQPGVLTADLVGAGEATVVAIAVQLAAVGGLTIANAAAIAPARADEAGFHVDDGTETVAQALDGLLLNASVLWALEPAGTIRLSVGELDGPSVETLRSLDVKREAYYRPLAARVGYRRNERQMNAGEIKLPFDGEVPAGQVVYEDGTTAEDWKPAEPGATNSADPDSPFGPDGATVGVQLLAIGDVQAAIVRIDDVLEGIESSTGAAEAAAAAEAARDAARDARDTAVQKALDAGGAAQASLSYRNEAGGFVTASQGHAQTASTRAGEAAGFSFTAQGYAQTASDRAGAASSSAVTAGGYRDQARGYVESYDSASATRDAAIGQRLDRVVALNGSDGGQQLSASISNTATAVVNNALVSPTDIRGSIARLDQQITAISSPTLNLIRNSTFAQGGTGWAFVGWNPEAQYGQANMPTQGQIGVTIMQTDPFVATAGARYSISADLRPLGLNSGAIFVDLQFEDAAGNVIDWSSRIAASGQSDYQRYERPGTADYKMIAPPNTTRARLRCFTENANINGNLLYARRFQAERSDVAHPWQEGSDADALTATVRSLQSAVASHDAKLAGAYWSVEARTGDGTVARVAVVASNANGSTTSAVEIVASQFSVRTGAGPRPIFAVVGNQVQIAGDLVVRGSIVSNAIDWDRLDTAQLMRVASASNQNINYGLPRNGQPTQVPGFALTLGPIRPSGRFTADCRVGVETNAGQVQNSTLNGYPATLRYVDDGIINVQCSDAQGNTYFFPFAAGVSVQRIRATSDFTAGVIIAAIGRGEDTGWVLDGDHYYRNVSASYVVRSAYLELTWSAI